MLKEKFGWNDIYSWTKIYNDDEKIVSVTVQSMLVLRIFYYSNIIDKLISTITVLD
jgi:hypothetical protein